MLAGTRSREATEAKSAGSKLGQKNKQAALTGPKLGCGRTRLHTPGPTGYLGYHVNTFSAGSASLGAFSSQHPSTLFKDIALSTPPMWGGVGRVHSVTGPWGSFPIPLGKKGRHLPLQAPKMNLAGRQYTEGTCTRRKALEVLPRRTTRTQ